MRTRVLLREIEERARLPVDRVMSESHSFLEIETSIILCRANKLASRRFIAPLSFTNTSAQSLEIAFSFNSAIHFYLAKTLRSAMSKTLHDAQMAKLDRRLTVCKGFAFFGFIIPQLTYIQLLRSRLKHRTKRTHVKIIEKLFPIKHIIIPK